MFHLFLFSMFTGCASINQIFSSKDLSKNNNPTTAQQNFSMNGKFIIFIKDKGFTGSLLWNSQDNQDTIKVFSPFNSLLATIKLNNISNQIRFEVNNKDSQENTKKILNKIFIEEKNIFTLRKLLLNPPVNLRSDNTVDIKLNEWDIRLEGLYGNKKIPDTVRFKKNEVSLKLLVKKWVD